MHPILFLKYGCDTDEASLELGVVEAGFRGDLVLHLLHMSAA